MLITEIAAAPSLPSSFVSLHSPDSWKLKGFLLLNDWVADPQNRQMAVMPLVSLCVPSFVPLHDLHSGLPLAAAAALSPKLVSLHDLHSGLLLAAAAALSPFMCLPTLSLLFAAAAASSPKLVLWKCYLGSMPV